MIWVDVAVLVIVALSVGVSFVRGFVKEFLSLVSWVAAVWVGLLLTRYVEPLFAGFIAAPSVRVVAAFALLFIATLIAGAVINHFAVIAVNKTGLRGTDRMLGVIFGTLRGIAVVALLVLLAGLTALPQDPWWQASVFMPYFEKLALWLTGFFPPDIAAEFSYS